VSWRTRFEMVERVTTSELPTFATGDPVLKSLGTSTARSTRGSTRRASTHIDPALRLVHWLSLAVAFVLLLYIDRNTWFFADEMDFLNRIIGPQTASTWLLPHNEHWSTVPLAIYTVLFKFAGMRTYWPYVVVLLLFHLTLVHQIWRLMIRIGVAGVIATVAAAILAVLGAGIENLNSPFQISFTLSLIFGVWAVFVADTRSRWSFKRLSAIWLLALLSLASSGIGLAMLLCVCLVAGGRRGWRALVATASVPALSYVLWYAYYGRKGVISADRVTGEKILHVPSYAWTGLTNALQSSTGLPKSGAILVVALGCYAIFRLRSVRGPALPAFAMFASALFVFFFIGIAREQFGSSQAESTRYVYISMMLLTPMIGLGFSELCQRWKIASALVAALAGFALVHNVQLLNSSTSSDSPHYELMQPFHMDLLGAAHLVQTRAKFVGVGVPQLGYPPTLSNMPLVPISSVVSWVDQGDLAANRQTPLGLLAAETYLQVSVENRPVFEPIVAPTKVVSPKGATVQGSCVRVSPGNAEIFRVTSRASLPVLGLNRSKAYLWLLSSAGLTGPALQLQSGDGSSFLNVSRVGDFRLANISGSPISVCGIS